MAVDKKGSSSSLSLRSVGDCRRRLWRIIDANLNRLLEGLRTCEDVLRFYFDEEACGAWKSLRSQVWDCVWTRDHIPRLSSRQAQADCGYDQSSHHEKHRDSIEDVFFANAQRAKEAARVLEELAKLWDAKEAQRFKSIRFQIYTLEKDMGLRLMGSQKKRKKTPKQKDRTA